MKKAVVLFLLVLSLFLAACAQENTVTINNGENRITIEVEVVDTPETRARGLMFREHLLDNAGMLFIFERPDYYNFWMKNTLIPLDIVHISEEGRIVDIIYAEPCKADPCPSFAPQGQALYVLEVNGNFSVENKLAVGNSAEISLR